MPNPEGLIRIGVSAGKAVGNAVVRNRAKRQLRASIDCIFPRIIAGWDMVFLARGPIRDAEYDQILVGVISVLSRANLLERESAESNE